MHFVRVATSDDIPDGKRHLVTYGPRSIVLLRIKGTLFAVDNVCPHKNGEMAFGPLEGFHLYCPLHAWVFDVRDGRAFFPVGAYIECFDVEEKDGLVFIASKQKVNS
jgi:nitrite reductase (NADH) small subunit